MKNKAKVIFHIDLNQFFCSVAMIKNPRLKGKAFAIGRENSYKGVISTASYEARAFGIHAGMALAEAYRIKPDLIVVDYGYQLYKDYSKKFFTLLHEYVDEIEQASVDEGYLDVTDITLGKGVHPVDLAKEIQTRALKELNLPCSIGIAPTLYLAKMASDLKKPLGITVLRIRDIPQLLYPLDIKDIWGCGKKTHPRLYNKGIHTIGEFVDPKNEEVVRSCVGNSYDWFLACLSGKSDNKVDPYRYGDPESCSHSSTYDNPLLSSEEVLNEMSWMIDELHKNIIRSNKYVKTVGITLRDTNFKTITRSISLDHPTKDKTVLTAYVEDLVYEHYQSIPYRLVGVTFSNLKELEEEEEEITLFNFEDVYKRKGIILDIISDFKNKYGDNIIKFEEKNKD